VRVDLGEFLGQDAAREHRPHTFPGRIDEQLCVGIVEQPILAFVLGSATRSDPQRGGSHALGDIPGVVIGSGHQQTLSTVNPAHGAGPSTN